MPITPLSQIFTLNGSLNPQKVQIVGTIPTYQKDPSVAVALPMVFPNGIVMSDPTFMTVAQKPSLAGGILPDIATFIGVPPGSDPNNYFHNHSTMTAVWSITFTVTGYVAGSGIGVSVGFFSGYNGVNQALDQFGSSSNPTPIGSTASFPLTGNGTFTLTADYFGGSPHNIDNFFTRAGEIPLYANIFADTTGTLTSITVTDVHLDCVFNGSVSVPTGGFTTNGSALAADAYNGVLAMIWSSGSDTRLARHLSPSQNIGIGTSGWETSQVLTATTNTQVSILFPSSDIVVIQYGGIRQQNTSAGASGLWTTLTGSSFAYGGSVGRSSHRTGFFFTLTGSYDSGQVGTSGLVSFLQDVGTMGNSFLGANNIDVNCVGQRAGGVWLDDKWFSLNTVYDGGTSTERTASVTSANGRSFTNRTYIAVIVDRICSLIKTCGDKSLVGLTWNTISKQCKAVRSYDSGVTWEQDTSYISVIPALDIPPTLVAMQDGVYAVWQVADVPNFAYSGDAGKTWT